MSLFLQNLLQSLRNMRRTKWQTLVSVIGLVSGIVSMTLSANWLWTELNHEHFRPEHRNLHILRFGMKGGGQFVICSAGMRYAIDSVAAQHGIMVGKGNLVFAKKPMRPLGDSEPAEKYEFQEVSPSWFDVMQPEILAGDVQSLFERDDRVLIGRSVAERFFKSVEGAMGKSVYSESDSTAFTVVGVFDDRYKETSFYCNFIFRDKIDPANRFNNSWLGAVMLMRSDKPEEDFKILQQGVNGSPRVSWWELGEMQPLRYKKMIDEHKNFLDAYLYPIAFVGISFVLLLGALVNLLMVCISTFLGRTREYTLRRSLGGSAEQNNLWILTEVLPAVFVSIALSAVMVEWLNHADLVPGSKVFIVATFSWVALATLAVQLLFLLYPMWLMRRAYRLAFAGRSINATTHGYLLVVQCFACALMLFITLGMQRQISDMIYGDLGFDRENILRLKTGYVFGTDLSGPVFNRQSQRDIADAFKREAGAGVVDAIALPMDIVSPIGSLAFLPIKEEVVQQVAPLREDNNAYAKKLWEIFGDIHKYHCKYMELPISAFDFFNIRVDEGIKPSLDGLAPNELPALVNREALEELQEVFPLRQKYRFGARTQGGAVGFLTQVPDHCKLSSIRVTGTMHVARNSFFETTKPLFIFGVPDNHDCHVLSFDAIYVKHLPDRREEAEAAMRRILIEDFDIPEDKIDISSLEEHIEAYYEEPVRVATILSLITALSIFITFSGVFSLLLYSLRLRRRQMAIRRVMGAELRDVLRATLPPYLIYTLLGGVLAYVPAHLFMERWMSSFTRGEVPGLGFMALIIAAMLLVVFLLVLWQVRRAMNEKPVDVLKPEA